MEASGLPCPPIDVLTRCGLPGEILLVPDDFILQWGSPVLHERAPLVKNFDELLIAQARRLARKLEEVNGAGLAATQIGSLRRMFAFRLSDQHPTDVIVNPEVVWQSEESELFHEACLSFNSTWVAVRRPCAVRVVGFDAAGNHRELECEGFEASLMQHEIDHLDGLLTLDRAELDERRRAVNALLNPDNAVTAAA
jgi:peptide deformylase